MPGDNTRVRNTHKDTFMMVAVFQYLMQIIHFCLYWMPFYDAFRLYREREKYFLEEGYQRSKATGAGVIDPLPLFLRWLRYFPVIDAAAPRIYVFSGTSQTLKAIGEYGEGNFPDSKAREPHDRIKKATQTTTIVNMSGRPAQEEKIKIAHILKNDRVFHVALELGNTFLWDNRASFQNNITWVGATIIGKCFLGIPEVPMHFAPLLRRSNDLLSSGRPDPAEVESNRAEIMRMSDQLMEQHAEEILQARQYIRAQIQLAGTETMAEKLALLKETHGGGGLLVESNFSTLIMFAMAHISQSPEILRRLRDEIDRAGEIKNAEDLKKLVWLDCIYRETLRHLSPSAVVLRKTSVGHVLPVENARGQPVNYRTAPNSLLFFAIRKIHHDPELWPNPEVFDPSRFDTRQRNEESRFMGKHFFPFSGGKRSCPAGHGFIELGAKAFIAGFFSHSDLRLNECVETIPVNAIHPRWHREYYGDVTPRARTATAEITSERLKRQ